MGLNEQASAYVSTQPDGGRREVFDHPGLRALFAYHLSGHRSHTRRA